MDTEAIVTLIADLYRQVAQARRELADAVETIKTMQAQLATQADEEAPAQ